MSFAITSHLQTRPTPPFTLDGTPIPLDAKETIAFIEELDNEFKGLTSLCDELEGISAHVYSRSAKPDVTQVKHTGWKNDIQTCKKKLDALETKVQKQFLEKFTSIEETSIEKALRVIRRLQDRIISCKEEHAQLDAVLGKPKYTAAHARCRTSIKTCEEILAKALPQQPKRKECEAERTKLKETIIEAERDINRLPQALQHQIKKVHRDALEFYDRKIASLTQAPQALSDAAEAPPPAEQNVDLPFVLAIEQYIESFSTVELDPLFGFQNASWIVRKFYQEQKYKEIWGQIEGLKLAAKGIQQVRKDLQQVCDDLRDGILKLRPKCDTPDKLFLFYENALSFLEESIKKEKNRLLDQPLTAEVHTGLYYAARLSHALSKNRHMLRNAVRAASDPASLARIKLNEKITQFVKTKCSRGVSNPQDYLYTLFDAADQFYTLPPLKEDAAPYVVKLAQDSKLLANNVLSFIGFRTVQHDEGMHKRVFSTLFRKAPMSEISTFLLPSELPLNLKRYLLQACCDWLFFSDSTSGSLPLTVALTFLETNKSLQPLLDGTLKSDKNCKVLIDTYKTLATFTPPERTLIEDIKRASQLLSLPISKPEKIVSYSEASLLAARIASFDTSILHPDASSFYEIAKAIIEGHVGKIRGENRFPPFSPEGIQRSDPQDTITKLFSELTLALWGKPDEKEGATTKLKAFLKELTGPKALPHLGVVQILLILFVMQNPKELSAVEMEIAKVALKEFLINESMAALIKKHVSILSIDQLLYRFCEDQDLMRTLEERLGTEGMAEWKEMMALCAQFDALSLEPKDFDALKLEPKDSEVEALIQQMGALHISDTLRPTHKEALFYMTHMHKPTTVDSEKK